MTTDMEKAIKKFADLAEFLGQPLSEVIEDANLVQMVKDRRDLLARIKDK